MARFTFETIEQTAMYREPGSVRSGFRITLQQRSLVHWVLIIMAVMAWIVIGWRWGLRLTTAPLDRVLEAPLTAATFIAILTSIIALRGMRARDVLTWQPNTLTVAHRRILSSTRSLDTSDVTNVDLVEVPPGRVDKVLGVILFFYRWIRPRHYALRLHRSDGEPETFLGGLEDMALAEQVMERIATAWGREPDAPRMDPIQPPAGRHVTRILWATSLVGLIGLCLFGSSCVGLPLGEVEAGEDWQEVSIERHLGPYPLVFWAEVVVRGKAHRLSKRRRPQLPKVTVVEIEVRQGDEVIDTLACDPLQMGWNRYDTTTNRRWMYDGPMIGCSTDRAPSGPFTVRARLSMKEQHEDIDSIEVNVVPKQ